MSAVIALLLVVGAAIFTGLAIPIESLWAVHPPPGDQLLVTRCAAVLMWIVVVVWLRYA